MTGRTCCRCHQCSRKLRFGLRTELRRSGGRATEARCCLQSEAMSLPGWRDLPRIHALKRELWICTIRAGQESERFRWAGVLPVGGDGNCLFRSVAQGRGKRMRDAAKYAWQTSGAGESAVKHRRTLSLAEEDKRSKAIGTGSLFPSVFMRRAGQELRRLAVEELIKRREVRRFATRVCSVQMPAGHAWQDIGWIVEGDFDEYVARPRLPRSPGSYDDFSCAKTSEHLQDGSARHLGRRARAVDALPARAGNAAGGQGLSSSIDLRGRACNVAFLTRCSFRCIWWRMASSGTS